MDLIESLESARSQKLDRSSSMFREGEINDDGDVLSSRLGGFDHYNFVVRGEAKPTD